MDISKIFGRIEYVDVFEDYSVRVVEMFADLRVVVVPCLADAPGKWEIVDNLPDFRIKIVDQEEDFTIEYVTEFPSF
jgi:hypothetical protein